MVVREVGLVDCDEIEILFEHAVWAEVIPESHGKKRVLKAGLINVLGKVVKTKLIMEGFKPDFQKLVVEAFQAGISHIAITAASLKL